MLAKLTARCPPTPPHPTPAQVLDKTSTRKLMQAIASLGPAACLAKLALDQVGAPQPPLRRAAAWHEATRNAPALTSPPLRSARLLPGF